MDTTRKRLFLYAFVLFSIDALTKWMTYALLGPKRSVAGIYPVFHNVFGIDLSLQYVTNTGASWGSFAEHQIPLLAFRVLFIAGLLVYLFTRNKTFQWPWVLILVGAVGNVVDYFCYGHVIDMIAFTFWGYHYPVFNIADSCVCIGAVWLARGACCEAHKKGEERSDEQEGN